MTPRSWIYIFILAIAGYFTGLAIPSDALQLIFKPLLAGSLLGYFLKATKDSHSRLKSLIAVALGFCMAGDILLMCTRRNELFFMGGLVAFLIAHIFYIICFHKIRQREQLPGKWPAAVLVGIYFGWIMSVLFPHLGALKIPVLVYGAVISFMCFLAMQLYQLPDNRTAQFLLTGAILFVVSDSILALTKFYRPLSWSGWPVMVTYVLAQWLLIRGCCRYILSAPRGGLPASN